MERNNKNLRDWLTFMEKQLHEIYEQRELQTIISRVTEDITNIPAMEIPLHYTDTINQEEANRFTEAVNRLQKHEPLQYILGETEFYDVTLSLTRGVFIPRPETEELTEWIINDTPNTAIKILDIGTGTGAIAITLAKHIPNAEVYASEMNDTALKIAKENATRNSVTIHFIESDILKWQQWEHTLPEFDIIVSNPPYIFESDKKEMENNVLGYEPTSALFVKDEDPLIFYRTILDFAQNNLSRKGKIYFEIHHDTASGISTLLKSYNFSNVDIRKDIHGKYRMAIGIKTK